MSNMVVTLDEDLTFEEQKLFGELYDEHGHNIKWCKWCGTWGIYVDRSNYDSFTLRNLDGTDHICHNLDAIRGYYQKENF